MTFKELCEARYSCRAYKPEAIPAEKMDYVLECARLAPSAVNFQPWRLQIVTDAEGLAKLCSTYKRDWIQTAPCIIIVSAVKSEAWTRRIDGKCHSDVDASIITEHITLAATEQGLGTCWVCNFDAALCHELFAMAEDEEAVALVPIGFPADEPSEKKRKSLSDIIKS